MSRDWKNMKSDEIYAIWSAYMRSEFQQNPLTLNYYEKDKCMRISGMEMIRLVEELMDRLEIKEKIT